MVLGAEEHGQSHEKTQPMASRKMMCHEESAMSSVAYLKRPDL